MASILIADNDELQMRALKKRITAMKGYVEIDSVSCGENAVEYCMRHVPDLLLINAFLPGIGGFETAGRVKELFPKVEVCIISSGRDLPMCKKALGIKARAFLEKPVSEKALESILEDFRTIPETGELGKIIARVEAILESRDFSRAYYESRQISCDILSLSRDDYEMTLKIMRTVKNRVLSRYMDSPEASGEEREGGAPGIPDETFPVNASRKDDEVIVEMWVFRFLDYLFRQRFIRQHRIVEPVFDYIHDNMNKTVKASAVSETCHISQQYLLRLFKQNMKMSMLDYAQHYKIMIARWQLSFREISTQEAALRIGFEDCAYFARIFKKLERITPHKYVIQIRKARECMA